VKCAIELETFAVNAKLPDGFRFKEWQPGNLVAFSPANEDQVYLDSYLVAVERISDEKFETFEITCLRKPDGSSLERGKIFLVAETLAHAVDEAVSKLEAS
jgi:hypothetical protein